MPKAYMLLLTAAQNIPLPGVRGKYGKLDKTDCTAFLLWQICGVLGFTINDAVTNFS